MMENDIILAQLGARIRMYRQMTGISQNMLAQKSDLSRTVISRLEQGELTNIQLSSIIRIAHVLGVTLHQLIQNVDEEPDTEWGADNIFESNITATCYPPELAGFHVTTLMQFVVYLPLIRPHELINKLKRLAGCFVGNERHVLRLINQTIAHIPNSMAKKYADDYVASMKALHINAETQTIFEHNFDEANAEYSDYMREIKNLDKFYKTVAAIGEHI